MARIDPGSWVAIAEKILSTSFHIAYAILIVWYVHVLGKWSHVPFLISVLVTWRVVHAWSRRESPKLCHGNPTLFCEDPEFCYLPNQCVWTCPFMKERFTKHV